MCTRGALIGSKDTSIKAIILRHVSRLKPSALISLSTRKNRFMRAMNTQAVTMILIFIVLTFGKYVLHDHLQFIGTDLHVLQEGGGICSAIAQIHSRVTSTHTHLARNLLVNDPELFFLLSLFLMLEQFSLEDK